MRALHALSHSILEIRHDGEDGLMIAQELETETWPFTQIFTILFSHSVSSTSIIGEFKFDAFEKSSFDCV